MSEPFCFDCRFFVPEGKWRNDLTSDQWDDCMEGECRAGLPALGQLLTDLQGETFRHFGKWPKVMASEWCGAFTLRESSNTANDVAPRSPTLAD